MSGGLSDIVMVGLQVLAIGLVLICTGLSCVIVRLHLERKGREH